MDNYHFIQNLLEQYLGKSIPGSKGDVSFYCPICKHKNPKLIVNLNSGFYNCWTCHPKTSGKSLVSLLKKIGAPSEALTEMKSYFSHDTVKIEVGDQKTVTLPKEFKTFDSNDSEIEKKHAKFYLKKRGIGDQEIRKYNIGYCSSGRYTKKVIIPSYDSSGRLNYFIARSFEKEPNQKIDAPECKKSELIGFEYYINWNVPVILCEGIFDAIAIKRNAIPLFGKTIPKALMIKLLQPEVKTVYLALDIDAIMESMDHAKQLLDYGKEVYLITLNRKDPSDIGFEGMTKLLQEAKPLNETELLMLKMKTSLWH